MRRYILLSIVLLAGCSSARYAQQRTSDTYLQTQRLDSLFKAAIQRDSIYVRDSIFVREKGDTITKYVERIRYQYKTRTDTLYRYRLQRDTVFISRTDSLTIERPVYVEKPIKWYNQAFIWFGRLCCIAFILWVIFLYLKKKV
jgi:hypothetical protein